MRALPSTSSLTFGYSEGKAMGVGVDDSDSVLDRKSQSKDSDSAPETKSQSNLKDETMSQTEDHEESLEDHHDS